MGVAFCHPSWSGINSHFYVLELDASVAIRALELAVPQSLTHQDTGPALAMRKWGPAGDWRGAVFHGYC